jgi:hypothetical protein
MATTAPARGETVCGAIREDDRPAARPPAGGPNCNRITALRCVIVAAGW